MANGDLETALLQAAWLRLWAPGTPYHLPAAMRRGVRRSGVAVPALDTLAVADLGPIPLFEDTESGRVSITLRRSALSGLAAVSPRGFRYDGAARTFQATIELGALRFAGACVVDSGARGGSAVATARLLLGGAAAVPEPLADGEPLELAADYRTQLTAMGGNGLTLVGSYYDNNDALDEICAGDNVFTFFWPTLETEGPGPTGETVTVDSAVLAEQTTAAAAAPDDPADVVGYPAYSLHSYTMKGFMLAALLEAEEGAPPEEKQRYAAAAAATVAFTNATVPDATQQTVGSVMNTVATSPTLDAAGLAALAAADVRLPFQDEVDERVARLTADYYRQRAAGGGAADRRPAIRGTFADLVTGASLAVAGTLTASGEAPDLTLTVAVTEISAELPPLAVTLATQSRAPLFAAAASLLASSRWIQDLLRRRLADTLDGPELRTYLEARLNQALAQAFGGRS